MDRCFFCSGSFEVKDVAGMMRPCSACRKEEYEAWAESLRPLTERRVELDDNGRCCGRKPLVYKRPTLRYYCDKCGAEFGGDGKQRANHAWLARGDTFVAKYPASWLHGKH